MSDKEETRIWKRAYSMAHKMGYGIRECRIFAMAYVRGFKNGTRKK